MGRLKELIAYFVDNVPYTFGRTELIKFIYLFEYYHLSIYGRQYTDAVFIRYKNGPFSVRVLNVVEQMTDTIYQEQYMGKYGPAYNFRVINTTKIREYKLPEEQINIAKFVINLARNKPLKELLDLVYSTPPMVKVLMAEQIDGKPHYKEELDMSARNSMLAFTKKELKEAKERNSQRKRRGTDEDYFAHLLNEHRAFGLVRRRATQWLSSQK